MGNVEEKQNCSIHPPCELIAKGKCIFDFERCENTKCEHHSDSVQIGCMHYDDISECKDKVVV